MAQSSQCSNTAPRKFKNRYVFYGPHLTFLKSAFPYAVRAWSELGLDKQFSLHVFRKVYNLTFISKATAYAVIAAVERWAKANPEHRASIALAEELQRHPDFDLTTLR